MWSLAAAGAHHDPCLDSQERHKRASDGALALCDQVVGGTARR